MFKVTSLQNKTKTKSKTNISNSPKLHRLIVWKSKIFLFWPSLDPQGWLDQLQRSGKKKEEKKKGSQEANVSEAWGCKEIWIWETHSVKSSFENLRRFTLQRCHDIWKVLGWEQVAFSLLTEQERTPGKEKSKQFLQSPRLWLLRVARRMKSTITQKVFCCGGWT